MEFSEFLESDETNEIQRNVSKFDECISQCRIELVP